MYGELTPVGGGDPIPMLKRILKVGRRESCDIVLRFSNVSAHHCELMVDSGYWYVRDLNSKNGTKVNGTRITGRKRLNPGDSVAIAKHKYTIDYAPFDLGAVGPPPADDLPEDILGQSLLERAGLQRSKVPEKSTRYDPTNDNAGQIKDSNKPV